MPKIIDFTHTVSPHSPTWSGSCGFFLQTLSDYTLPLSNPSFKVQNVRMNCGIGTHIDTPSHCYSGHKTAHQFELGDLIAPAVLIDISRRFHSDNSLSQSDIQNFESLNGEIKPHTSVLIHTGWSKHWNSPKLYHNHYQFPYVGAEAANYLSSKCIHSLGIDTLSPDRPESSFPVHKLLLEKGIIIIENLNNLGKSPTSKFTLTIAPLKLENATESPARIWGTF